MLLIDNVLSDSPSSARLRNLPLAIGSYDSLDIEHNSIQTVETLGRRGVPLLVDHAPSVSPSSAGLRRLAPGRGLLRLRAQRPHSWALRCGQFEFDSNAARSTR